MNGFTFLDKCVKSFNSKTHWSLPPDKHIPIRNWKNIQRVLWAVVTREFQLSDIEAMTIGKKIIAATAKEVCYIELNPDFAPYTYAYNNRIAMPRNMTIHFRWAIVKDNDGVEYISISTRLGNRKKKI